MMLSTKTLRAPVASPARNLRAHGVADTIKSTVNPRVAELRNTQLSQGLTSVSQVMSFSGPAPELVNGRLAMLGFFAAISAEITSHETVVQQFADAPGSVLAAAALFAVASIVPIVRGSAVLDDGAGEGLKVGSFNVTNELINGRAAMIGLAIMMTYEAFAHAALF